MRTLIATAMASTKIWAPVVPSGAAGAVVARHQRVRYNRHAPATIKPAQAAARRARTEKSGREAARRARAPAASVAIKASTADPAPSSTARYRASTIASGTLVTRPGSRVDKPTAAAGPSNAPANAPIRTLAPSVLNDVRP